MPCCFIDRMPPAIADTPRSHSGCEAHALGIRSERLHAAQVPHRRDPGVIERSATAAGKDVMRSYLVTTLLLAACATPRPEPRTPGSRGLHASEHMRAASRHD